MDEPTVRAYDENAAVYAARHAAITPGWLYDLVDGYFHRGGATLDVGCGCGRDVAWLIAAGYPARGCDASGAMLRQARALHPDLGPDTFFGSELPDLMGLPDRAAANVLCSAVFMHLPEREQAGAASALARILAPGGRLIVTWRGSAAVAEREEDGRLYTPLAQERLIDLLRSADIDVLEYRPSPPDLAAGPMALWKGVAGQRRCASPS